MADTRPDDLIPVDEAARRVDRSRSTVRAWVRAGELTGYREDPTHPENSRLLVSHAELLTLVVGAGKAANPGRIGRDEDLDALRAELDAARNATLDALRTTITALEGRVRDLERAGEAEKQRAEEWRARALGAEAERDALRRERGLPWWRRLLGGPTELAAPLPEEPVS